MASGKRDKMDLALKRVKALIDTADSNSAAKVGQVKDIDKVSL